MNLPQIQNFVRFLRGFMAFVYKMINTIKLSTTNLQDYKVNTADIIAKIEVMILDSATENETIKVKDTQQYIELLQN